MACTAEVVAPPALPDYESVLVTTADLPDGEVSQPYSFQLEASGGDGAYQWEVGADIVFPSGLSLDRDGRIHGTPNLAGDFPLAISVRDGQGEVKFSTFLLRISLLPDTIGCGDVVSGSFDGDGWGINGEVDWERHESYEWLRLAYPDPEITRMDLYLEAPYGGSVVVALPNEAEGSHDIEDGYATFYVYEEDEPVTIDLGTDPGLGEYAGRDLSMLVVSGGTGPWTLRVECSDGPIIWPLWTLPAEVGTEFAHTYRALGNDDVRLWTEDPLPEWASWDEETGLVSGVPSDPGGWNITVEAEDSEGRYRAEESLISSYVVNPVGCDEVVSFTTEQGMYEGDFTGPYDARGYQVFSVTSDDPEVGAITLRTGVGDLYMGVASPIPWYRFYGNAGYDFYYNEEAAFGLTPRDYPFWGAYRDVGEMIAVVGPTYVSEPIDLEIDCDRRPWLEVPNLPVLDPGVSQTIRLPIVGGTPPYTVETTGMPVGVSLDDGVLRTLPLERGTSDVTVSITDSEGRSTTEPYTLHVGKEEACAGFETLACGDDLSGEFTTPYYMEREPYTDASTMQFCVVVEPEWDFVSFNLRTGFEAEATMMIPDPGRSVDEAWDLNKMVEYVYVDEEETVSVAISDEGWPDLVHWDRLPVFAVVQAYEPGEWTVTMNCN
jgi:hypothetical protein